MLNRSVLRRGFIALTVVGGMTLALLVSPVEARSGITKKKVKNIATKVFKAKIGPATASLLRKADDLVVAQQNTTGDISGSSHQANLLTITAPYDGFLIISGQVSLDEDTDSNDFVCLRPRVDGTNVVAGYNDGEASCGDLPGATAFDNATLSYVVVAAVSAGAHTVTQDILGADLNDGFFLGSLVAQFASSGSVTNVP